MTLDSAEVNHFCNGIFGNHSSCRANDEVEQNGVFARLKWRGKLKNLRAKMAVVALKKNGKS